MYPWRFSEDLLTILGQGQPSSNPTSQFLILGLLFAGMWFLIIAPQRKRQKDQKKMLAALAKGDEIVTSGGLYGTIVNVKDDRLVIKISDSVRVELNKNFVQSKVTNETSDRWN